MLPNYLMNKSGIATVQLAKELINIEVNSRIPTVTEVSERFNLPRGTVQNAMNNLVESGAINFCSHGYQGSILTHKDVKKLFEICGISDLAGIMPFPYSKRQEGLASGLSICASKYEIIPVYLAYMRGAKKRLMMVQKGRYDFAIVSRYAAEEYIKDNDDLKIIKTLGPETYLGKHVIIFSDSNSKCITNGMKVGIDYNSNDQCRLTKIITKDLNVELVPMEYYQALDMINKHELDAVISNIDEFLDRKDVIHYVDFNLTNGSDTEACIVISKKMDIIEKYIVYFAQEKEIVSIQNRVIKEGIRYL